MDINKQRSAIDQLAADKKAWQKVGILSSLTACFLVVLLLVFGKGNEKVVIVPPVVTKTFWVDDREASPEYIEQMAVFFAQLALNGTASNSRYMHNLLLQYVTPRAHGALKAELDVAADKLKRGNASQAFHPYEIIARKNKAQIKGRMVTLVGDKVTSNRDEIYDMEFSYENGRLYVSRFKKVESPQPGADT